MNAQRNVMFMHGLEGSSKGFKATFLRQRFPTMITPDFCGELDERMQQLTPLLVHSTNWVLVGSSFGGLMAALFACHHPHLVHRLVLLAPALARPFFADNLPAAIDNPVTIYHGSRDTVVPLDPIRTIARKVFLHLTFIVVDDDHQLHHTVQQIDWETLLFA